MSAVRYIQVPITPGHYSYVHLDADGCVLYVGMTGSPAHRVGMHSTRAIWWDRVADIRWWPHPTRDDARWHERSLIERHLPPFNKADIPGAAHLRQAIAEQRRHDLRRRSLVLGEGERTDLARFHRRSPRHLAEVLDAISEVAA